MSERGEGNLTEQLQILYRNDRWTRSVSEIHALIVDEPFVSSKPIATNTRQNAASGMADLDESSILLSHDAAS